MVLENLCPLETCNQGAGERRWPGPMAHWSTRDLIIKQSLGTAKHNLNRYCKYMFHYFDEKKETLPKALQTQALTALTNLHILNILYILPIWEVEHQLFAQGRPGPDLAGYVLLAQRCGRWAAEQLQAEERSCQQTPTSHTPWMRSAAHYCSYCAGLTLSVTPFQSDITILI